MTEQKSLLYSYANIRPMMWLRRFFSIFLLLGNFFFLRISSVTSCIITCPTQELMSCYVIALPYIMKTSLTKP